MIYMIVTQLFHSSSKYFFFSVDMDTIRYASIIINYYERNS